MRAVARGWFSLSTPIWTNFGTGRGLPISCFGSYIGDTMESILSTQAEVGMMTKHGGGTSAYFGDLRPRGAGIRDNGKSAGSVHFMALFQALMEVVSQGSTRRGNFAAYLPIDHGDVEEFLTIKSDGAPLQHIQFGVCVSDAWMESMIAGDMDKRRVWAKVLQSRINTGMPYVFWSDNVNNNTVDVYKDKGLKIRSSNLCVTGGQRVVTDRGMLTAKELYEQGGSLKVFDDDKVSNASAMRLIERDVDVYRITLANGMTHDVTGYHKVKVRTQVQPVKHADVSCRDLQSGDLVAIQTRKGLFGPVEMEDEAFLLGTYQSNGTQTDDCVMLDVWEHSFDLLDEIEGCYQRVSDRFGLQLGVNGRTYDYPHFTDCGTACSTVAKKRLSGRGLKKIGFVKGVVPDWVWNGTEETQWQYIRGLYYADGTVNVSKGDGDPLYLSLACVNREFLKDVQLLLANLGITSSLAPMREAGIRPLPDGKGGYADYQTQDLYRLTTSNKPDALEFERRTGFLSRKGVVLEDREYRDNTKKHHKVVSVDHIGRQDVYCLTVDSEEHHFVCNGVVTRNCTEIMLPSSDDESFVCCLLSMNAATYDDWKGSDAVETAVMLLDAVMTEFIEKASGLPFMERPVAFARRHRALGIGVLGWHTLLQRRMIPFESMDAKYLNVELFRRIRDDAYAASARLAVLLGEPELLEGYGRRHTTLMAVAPTKSSSFILGQASQGVEPYRTNYDVQDRQKGKFVVKNPQLEALLESRGRNDRPTWDSIMKNFGGVGRLDCLTDREKEVFKTYAEISPMEVVIQAAQRQKFIDQGQSINLMVHPDTPAREINALMIEAWRLGLKSLYYQYNLNAAQKFGGDIRACKSCEA